MADFKTCSIDPLDVSSRPKTVDTIIEKLGRLSTRLDRVQDLAGVRVDVDFLLDAQTSFAYEVANLFNAVGTTKIKDIRDSPHSGYRAIHVHVTVPAGRCEVQIRTRDQSAWANAYEAFADTFGRGLRYGERHSDPNVQKVADEFHSISQWIARNEKRLQWAAWCRSELDRLAAVGTDESVLADLTDRVSKIEGKVRAQSDRYLKTLAAAERTLKAMRTGHTS